MYHMRAEMALLSLEQLAERMKMPIERLRALESGDQSADFTEEEDRLFYSVLDDEIRRLSCRPGAMPPYPGGPFSLN